MNMLRPRQEKDHPLRGHESSSDNLYRPHSYSALLLISLVNSIPKINRGQYSRTIHMSCHPPCLGHKAHWYLHSPFFGPGVPYTPCQQRPAGAVESSLLLPVPSGPNTWRLASGWLIPPHSGILTRVSLYPLTSEVQQVRWRAWSSLSVPSGPNT